MQNFNGLRLLYLITPPIILLIPLSCLVFLLERISSSLLAAHTIRSFGTPRISLPLPSNSTSNSTTNTSVSIRTDFAPYAAIVGVAVFTFCVGILGGCGIWELRRVEGSPRYQRMWVWLLYAWNAATVGVCVGVLAWTSAVQGNEKGWGSLEDVGKGSPKFTKETWTCQIHKFFPSQGWAGSVCGLSKATRFMLIPLALAAALTILTTWILNRDRGGIKWLMGGKGRYAAFDSVYEMNPSTPTLGPVPMPYGPPMPYRQPVPYGQPLPYGQPITYGQPGSYFHQGPQYQPGPQFQSMPQVLPQAQPPFQTQPPPPTQKDGETAGTQPAFR